MGCWRRVEDGRAPWNRPSAAPVVKRDADVYVRSLSLYGQVLDAGAWRTAELIGRSTPNLPVSCVVEMSVSKPTHRRIVGEEGRAFVGACDGVHNVTGGGWDRVKLSVMVGGHAVLRYQGQPLARCTRPSCRRASWARLDDERARLAAGMVVLSAGPPGRL